MYVLFLSYVSTIFCNTISHGSILLYDYPTVLFGLCCFIDTFILFTRTSMTVRLLIGLYSLMPIIQCINWKTPKSEQL